MDCVAAQRAVIVDEGDGHILAAVQQCDGKLGTAVTRTVDGDRLPLQIIVEQPIEIGPHNKGAAPDKQDGNEPEDHRSSSRKPGRAREERHQCHTHCRQGHALDDGQHGTRADITNDGPIQTQFLKRRDTDDRRGGKQPPEGEDIPVQVTPAQNDGGPQGN